jgi:hypothetical protein
MGLLVGVGIVGLVLVLFARALFGPFLAAVLAGLVGYGLGGTDGLAFGIVFAVVALFFFRVFSDGLRADDGAAQRNAPAATNASPVTPYAPPAAAPSYPATPVSSEPVDPLSRYGHVPGVKLEYPVVAAHPLPTELRSKRNQAAAPPATHSDKQPWQAETSSAPSAPPVERRYLPGVSAHVPHHSANPMPVQLVKPVAVRSPPPSEPGSRHTSPSATRPTPIEVRKRSRTPTPVMRRPK